mgnify:CR=1 FL=1
MQPCASLYLRRHISEKNVDFLKSYLDNFGHAGASVEHWRKEVILHLHDRRDVIAIRSQFPELVDAWVDHERGGGQ